MARAIEKRDHVRDTLRTLGGSDNRDRKGRGGIAWRAPRNCLQLDIWTGVDFYVQQGAILHKMASVDVLQANTYGSKAPATKRHLVLLTLAGRPEFGNLTVKGACVPKSGSRTGFCEDLEKGIVAIEKVGDRKAREEPVPGLVRYPTAVELAAVLCGKRQADGSYLCHCLCRLHRRRDINPSLSVRDGRRGRPVFRRDTPPQRMGAKQASSRTLPKPPA